MNPKNELAWIFEILKRAIIARKCGLREEAASLCNIAENRYKVLLKSPSIETQMKAAYSNTKTSIENVKTMVSDDSFWTGTVIHSDLADLLHELRFGENDINTENL